MSFRIISAALMTCMALAAGSGASAQAADEPYKIYLSHSFTGNDWMTQAENMLRALATSKNMKDKVTLEIQVAGTDAQKQSQQINGMVQAGADAIVIFPASETLLNRAVKNACNNGVVVVTFASPITEPCAYNLTDDNARWARIGAEWLADAVGEGGNVVMVTGATGFGVDTLRNNTAKAIFDAKGVNVVATVIGMWSDSVVRAEMTKLLATRDWDTIDGLWVQEGCFTLGAMQDEAGIPDGEKKPMACSATNGARVQMLPAGTEVEGADGAYRAMGIPGISMAAGPYIAALALKTAVEILDGAEKEHLIITDEDYMKSVDAKLCEEGTWEEMTIEKCNVFKPSVISSPVWYSPIYTKELPGIGLNAALNGVADE